MAVLGQMKILEATQNQRKTYELAEWEMTEGCLGSSTAVSIQTGKIPRRRGRCINISDQETTVRVE
jgi:hypothetical protein